MPFGGLVVNRLHLAAETDGTGDLEAELGADLAGRVATAASELAALAEREAASLEELRTRLGDPPTIVVPELEGDIHDVEGLALVRAHLFDGD